MDIIPQQVEIGTFGYRHTEESKARMSEKHKVIIPALKALKKANEERSKPIICIQTGQEFPSIRAVARKFNVSRDYIRYRMDGEGKNGNLSFKRKDD